MEVRTVALLILGVEVIASETKELCSKGSVIPDEPDFRAGVRLDRLAIANKCYMIARPGNVQVCYIPPPLRLGVADDLTPAPIPALLGVMPGVPLAKPPILGVRLIASDRIVSALARSILDEALARGRDDLSD